MTSANDFPPPGSVWSFCDECGAPGWVVPGQRDWMGVITTWIHANDCDPEDQP